MVFESFVYTLPFKLIQRKKSSGVESHELGIQLLSSFQEITWPGHKLSAINSLFHLLCDMLHRLVETTCLPNEWHRLYPIESLLSSYDNVHHSDAVFPAVFSKKYAWSIKTAIKL